MGLERKHGHVPDVVSENCTMARILVIEDEAQILSDMLYLLQEVKHQVEGVGNGADGLELARKLLPDLIVCDIMLPDMNGYRILEELRKDEETASIPLLFVTALGSREDVRRGMNLGADDYIVKPFQPVELVTAIESRIQRQATITGDAQRKVENMRTNLTMSLPHEFRTPLMSILGYSELLLDDEHPTEPNEVRPMVETIFRSGTRLNHLIENYLLLGQIELNREQLREQAPLQRVSANSSARALNSQLQQIAQHYHRESDVQVQVEGASIHISEVHLHKVLSELLDNAFKFSESGKLVNVVARPVEESYWQVTITDHGRGMSPRQIKDLGAYVQFNRELYEQQGMGLGYTVARHLIELYGGRVSLTSELDQGTTVWVQIPLAKTAPKP
jgi:signal transduction histidine kinase